MRYFRITSLLIAMFSMQSCATLIEPYTLIEVRNDIPVGTKIYLNGVFQGEAPKTLEVRDKLAYNKNNPPLIELKLEGYEDAKIPLERKVQWGWLGLDLIGTAWPAAVDIITGAIFTYTPKDIKYDLRIKEEGSTN